MKKQDESPKADKSNLDKSESEPPKANSMADAMAIAAEVATTATSVQTSTFAIIADF
ncbi:TPA: hypothetical protein RPN31_004051, partial [Escherichia coli]|nr:hypothetical protein [Escherichia coli]